MVVTPARRRSTGGSLVVVLALLKGDGLGFEVRGSGFGVRGQAAAADWYGWESRSIA